jgi:hypothetical protein
LESTSASSGKNGNSAEPSADLSELVALVRELIPKAEAAAMWQARAEMLAGQVERLQLALEAPKPDSPEIAPRADSERVASETTQTPSEHSRRPALGTPSGARSDPRWYSRRPRRLTV